MPSPPLRGPTDHWPRRGASPKSFTRSAWERERPASSGHEEDVPPGCLATVSIGAGFQGLGNGGTRTSIQSDNSFFSLYFLICVPLRHLRMNSSYPIPSIPFILSRLSPSRQ